MVTKLWKAVNAVINIMLFLQLMSQAAVVTPACTYDFQSCCDMIDMVQLQN